MEIGEIIILVAVLVVFFIQKSQIENIKTYMSVFDVKKVKEYSEIMHEASIVKVDNFLQNNDKIKEASKAINKEVFKKVQKIYRKQMGDEYVELFDFVFEYLKRCSEEQREEILNKLFPNTKEKLKNEIQRINSDCQNG